MKLLIYEKDIKKILLSILREKLLFKNKYAQKKIKTR